MPPRKNITNQDIKIKKPTTKRTPKAKKPTLKIPTMIRISIPNTKKTSESSDVTTPKFKGKLDAQTKLDLSNEVARMQLVKSEPIVHNESKNVVNCKSKEIVYNKPKKGLTVVKRGRRRKVSEFIKDLDSENTVTRVELVKPVPIDNNEPKNIMNNESEEITQNNPKKGLTVLKKGRGRKVMSEFVQDPDSETTVAPIKIRRPWNNKFVPTKSETKRKSAPKKRLADSTVHERTKGLRSASRIDDDIFKKDKNGTVSPRITRSAYKSKLEDVTVDTKLPSILTCNTSPKSDTDIVESNRVNGYNSPTIETSYRVVSKPIIARKNSVNSNSSSNQSSIRDISGGSTTTCITVSSNEYVYFDNKMPTIKLANIDKEINNYKTTIDDSSLSDSDTSSSSSSENKSSQQLNNSIEIGSFNPVNLTYSLPTQNPTRVPDLSKLSSIIKKMDMEIMNWLTFDEDEVSTDLMRIKDKMFDILDSEFGIITHCQNLKRLLDHESNDNENVVEDNLPVEDNFPVKDNLPVEDNLSVEDNLPVEVNYEVNLLIPNKNSHVSNESDVKETNETPNIKDNDEFSEDSNDYVDDDDDAISIFAESITGMESSRLKSSIPSVPDFHDEEYVPQPTRTMYCAPDKYVYNPTKISDEQQNLKSKTICEKQNADSTSIAKETIEVGHQNHKQNENPASRSDAFVFVNHPPNLMAWLFKPIQGPKSVVLKGVCFFNLINSCKAFLSGEQCRFPHVTIDITEIRERLSKINEDIFIQEYMMVKYWPQLRRQYGVCFVDECVKRGLTRLLVEMALDFVIKANVNCRDDLVIKVHVIETTLLYLNNIDLREIGDLLMYRTQHGMILCDDFMKTIAESQNFSRFKQIFVKLTSFMVANERIFDLGVSSLILERLCILPYDEVLVRAMLDIIKHTTKNIFENSMISHFEKLISSKEVYKEYMSVKMQGDVSPVRSGTTWSPRSALRVQVPCTAPEEPTPLAPSPDTTNFDNMYKRGEELMSRKVEEPIITRTMDFMTKPKLFNAPLVDVSPGCSFTHNSPSFPRAVMRKDQNWTNSHFQNKRMSPQFNCPRPPRHMLRSPMKQPPQRLVTYANKPLNSSYVPRRPDPPF